MEYSLDNDIFNFAYEMALRDATLQKAYKGTDKIILRRNYKAREILKEYINSVFAGTSPCFYDVEERVEDSFREFIKEKKLTINDGKTPVEFTFGNTQKLINMTAKYMYISAYQDHNLHNNFQCCHCPMDSIIVEIVIKRIGEILSSDTESESTINKLANEYNNSNLTWRQFLRQSWSKITITNHGQYKLFQRFVTLLAERENLSSIDFDFKYWSSNTTE